MGGKGNKVIVGVDGSEQSMRALLWACKYLIPGLEKPNHCIILHIQPDDFFAAGPAYMLSSDVVNLVEIDARRTTQKIFSRALAICRDNNVEAETEVIAGEAKERLCQAADKLGADFLVLGSHGHGFFKRSIREKVLYDGFRIGYGSYNHRLHYHQLVNYDQQCIQFVDASTKLIEEQVVFYNNSPQTTDEEIKTYLVNMNGGNQPPLLKASLSQEWSVAI